MPSADLVLGQSAVMLVSPWKPVILFLTVTGWAWVVSKVFDPHAAKFFLGRSKWGIIHLVTGMVAVAVALAIPLKSELAFWIGWVLMTGMLIGHIAMFASITNKDARVPPSAKLQLNAVTKALSARRSKKDVKGAGVVRLTIRMPDKSVLPAPQADSPEYEGRMAAEELFFKAMATRAGQIDVFPQSKEQYKVEFTVDGMRTAGDALSAAMAIRVVDFWKTSARLDVNDRRKRLVGDANVELAAGKHKVRVTAAGVPGGMKVTLMLDPEKAVRKKPDELGLLPEQMADLKILVGLTQKNADDSPIPEAERKGVVLLSGPADLTRTATFYTVAMMHDAYTSSVQTLEIEQLANIEGIRHTVFDPAAEGAMFSTAARSLLRRDPDVLLLAELPDADTAKEVARADLERSRVYISLRAGSCLEALDTYAKAVGEAATAAKTIRGVLCQKSIRKLCTNCRVAYPPTPDMLKKLGVAGGQKVEQLYKKGGQVLIKNKPEACPVCGGGGYLGQEGIFELYRLDDECRDMLAQGNLAGVKAALRKRTPITLQTAAIRKAVEGKTSVEEVMRVTAPPAAGPSPAGKAADGAAAAAKA